MSSCAQWRLNRLIDRHPELVENRLIRIDTTLQGISPGDSVVGKLPLRSLCELENQRNPILIDTLYLDQGKLHITSYQKGDTVYIYGECEADTVYVDFSKDIETESVIYKRPRDWLLILAIVTALIIVILLRYLESKNQSKR